MTFIKLTNDNFTKTKIVNNNKRYYKNSDMSTYEYDNAIDSKSIIPLDFENFNISDINNEDDLNKINEFFNSINNKQEQQTFEKFIELKNNINEISNDLIKFNKIKNAYKIDRLNSRFIINDDFSYKKNVIKNNLYESYYRNSSYDLMKNTEYGFCNYNTINLYSNNDSVTHSNCIIYSNEISNQKNIYDIYDKQVLNISFRIIFRNLNKLSDINTLLHVPDLLDLYFIKSNLNNNIRLGLNLGNKTKLNKLDYSININNDSKQINSPESQYISSNSFLELNKWYFINLTLVKNGINYLINIYKDGVLFDKFELELNKEKEELFNSYICIGNKPRYFNFEKDDFVNYENAFDLFFSKQRNQNINGSLFNKDIKTKSSIVNSNNIQELINDNNIVLFDNSKNYTHAFNGEVSDIRFYNSDINTIKINDNLLNFIKDIDTEINLGLIFYLPVFFVPVIKKELSQFNLAIRKFDIKHGGYYNSFISNGCGVFQLNVENYLIEFCNKIKPNVVFGGNEVENIYTNNLENNLYNFFNLSSDKKYIKKGYNLQDIFLKNYNNTDNDQSCLTYNNLFILPNDNGIPKISWEPIKNVIDSGVFELENDYLKYFKNKNESNLYNINCKDIITNNSLYNINQTKRMINVSSEIIINNGNELSNNIVYTGYDLLSEFSNILYHDDRLTIDNLELNINELFTGKEKNLLNSMYYNVKSYYDLTKSNPITRNYIVDDLKLGNIVETRVVSENKNIIYRKLPLPYCDILKDYDNQFISVFNISNKLYNKKIKKDTFILKDNAFVTTNAVLKMNLKDNNGILYRNDCLTKVADWNYIGHIFYNEGLVQINNPISVYFGYSDFECEFEYESSLFVHQLDIPVDRNLFNISSNKSYDETMRHDDSKLNSDESFVYITDIHLHDENYNIIAKAKVARPIPKKQSDRFLIKLKMDY